jgi:hypothetical protein
MSAHRSTCRLCGETFVADRSLEAAYRESLGGDDKAKTEDLLCAINAYWALKRHMKTAHAGEMFVCPRQAESGRADAPEAFWDEDRTCSYCGSLHPDDFLDAVAAGAPVGPTDKSYKAYIDLPQAEPDKLRVVSSQWAPICPGEGWIEATPDLCETYDWQPWGEGRPGDVMWVTLMPQGPVRHGKFYFQHLDDDQRWRFIDLYNSKQMQLGYPGHFYVRPYFCAPA